MDLSKTTEIVTLLAALSMASERLVEIIKGYFPSLNTAFENPDEEGKRRVKIQIIGVIAGILTAALSAGLLPETLYRPGNHEVMSIILVGLMVSGGSGFWNSILTYTAKIKDVKAAQAKTEKEAAGMLQSGTKKVTGTIP